MSIIDKLKELRTLDGVVIIANGTVARLDANLLYVIESLKEIFPKSITDNIMLLLTNSTPSTASFEINSLGFDPKEVFYLQNPFAVWDSMQKKIKAGKLPDMRLRANIMEETEGYHANAAKIFSKMCEALAKTNKVPTNSFVELYDKKSNIEMRIVEAMTTISQMKEKETKLEEVKAKIQAGSTEASLYRKWRDVINQKADIQENTPQYNTLCGLCVSNCHLSCRLEYSVNKEVFKSCGGIGGEICKTCGHSYQHHFHGYKMWVTKIEQKETIDEAAKAKHEAAINKVHDSKKELADLQIQIAQFKLIVQEKRSLIQSLIDEYAAMSFGSSMVTHIQNMIDLIRLRIKAEKNEEVRAILRQDEERLINKLEAIKKSLLTN